MSGEPLAIGRAVDAIVIGASSGGVEALSVLLPSLPARLRLPVFVVLHLPPDRPSRLADIFSRKCAVPVREAEDKLPVEAGTVYFAPPDYHLLLDVGPTLALSADEAVNYSRPSIDVLFESARDIYGHRLLAMLLTGASHDGAAGIHAIRFAGGCAVVQRPDTAQASLMPESALKLGPVDFVLTLEEIAALLETFDAGAPGGVSTSL
jgi:two-component system chemotaxis response regulator CheB